MHELKSLELLVLLLETTSERDITFPSNLYEFSISHFTYWYSRQACVIKMFGLSGRKKVINNLTA